MKNFFISYNKADAQWAEWVAWVLEEEGYTTVLQAWHFLPGSNFVEQMQQAIANSERTIAILSQNYIDAQFTHPEWQAAFAEDPTGVERKLIPVKVGDCKVKGLLSQIVHVDLTGMNEAASRKKLVNGIRGSGKPLQKPDFPGASSERNVISHPAFPGGIPTPRPSKRRYWLSAAFLFLVLTIPFIYILFQSQSTGLPRKTVTLKVMTEISGSPGTENKAVEPIVRLYDGRKYIAEKTGKSVVFDDVPCGREYLIVFSTTVTENTRMISKYVLCSEDVITINFKYILF